MKIEKIQNLIDSYINNKNLSNATKMMIIASLLRAMKNAD